MKAIPLTKGFQALVDDADWPRLMLHSWYALEGKSGVYAACRVSDGGGKSHIVLMHRMIMDNPEKLHVDHKNHNTLDNRRDNLRVATPRQNQHNSRKNEAKTSQFKGVYWLSSRNRWVSDITLDTGRKRIGSFRSELEAARAYDAVARAEFGEFAKLNLG